LLRGIYAYGLESPNEAQQRAILPCISARDVLIQAESGIGRTAYVIAVLERIKPQVKQCQVLILVPTRDMALDLQSTVKALGDYLYVCCLLPLMAGKGNGISVGLTS